MMQIETDEIASRYPKHVNKVNIFLQNHNQNFCEKNYPENIAHIFLVIQKVLNKIADTFLKI